MEALEPQACYRALRTRDARFDGRFFTAVVSTGVFCRPVCPAPTPKLENCRFYRCAAAAQEAGFRPCLRCRPETAPGSAPWVGSSVTVSRALRLIADGALDEGSVETLAERVGVGERHLRRLFLRHLGTSPQRVAQTRRLLFAKKLIDETQLPMTQVAHAAGFSSVRRFNDAIRGTYDRAPSELRRGSTRTSRGRTKTSRVDGRRRVATQARGLEISLRLGFRPPYDWPALSAFLAARETRGLEEVGADFYRRSVRIGDDQGLVEVRTVAGENHLLARIRMANPARLATVVERLRRLFDLDADPNEINAHLCHDRVLAQHVRRHPGLRIPGSCDPFETAVRAILGQQVSVRAANTLMSRLVEQFGETLAVDNRGLDAIDRVFPSPQRLATADLRVLGLPRSRAQAISGLAQATLDGRFNWDASTSLQDNVSRLCELPGIGAWTAHYVAMRAFGEPDAFPAADLGLRRALGKPGTPAPTRAVTKAAEAWHPWRAYAALHLWTGGTENGTARR